jgi:hypothetical protein
LIFALKYVQQHTHYRMYKFSSEEIIEELINGGKLQESLELDAKNKYIIKHAIETQDGDDMCSYETNYIMTHCMDNYIKLINQSLKNCVNPPNFLRIKQDIHKVNIKVEIGYCRAGNRNYYGIGEYFTICGLSMAEYHDLMSSLKLEYSEYLEVPKTHKEKVNEQYQKDLNKMYKNFGKVFGFDTI